MDMSTICQHLTVISVLVSYEELTNLLEPMFEEKRIRSINQNLLKNIVDLMVKFCQIFDQLEFSAQPTLHNVVPSYYAMSDFVRVNNLDRPEIKVLKQQIQAGLDIKWVSSKQLSLLHTNTYS